MIWSVFIKVSIPFLYLFSSLEEILMIWQLRQNLISFLQSLLIWKNSPLWLFIDYASLLGNLEGLFSCCLPRFELLILVVLSIEVFLGCLLLFNFFLLLLGGQLYGGFLLARGYGLFEFKSAFYGWWVLHNK